MIGALERLLLGTGETSTNPQDDINSGPYGRFYAPEVETYRTATNEIREQIALWERVYPQWGFPMSAFLSETYITPEGQTRGAWELFHDVATGKIAPADVHGQLMPQLVNGKQIGAEWFEDWAEQNEANLKRWLGVSSDGAGWTQNDIDNAAAAIRDRVAQYGITFSEEQVLELAKTAVQYEYSNTRVIDSLLDGVNFATVNTGQIEQRRQDLVALASDYLVRLNDNDVNDLLGRLFREEMNVEDLRSYMTNQALINMPFLEGYTERGFTPVDVFKSPMNLAASELGIDVSSIDLMDPKWESVFIRADDNGNKRVATNMEVRDAVRSMEGWEQTDTARQNATDIGMWLGNIMGRI